MLFNQNRSISRGAKLCGWGLAGLFCLALDILNEAGMPGLLGFPSLLAACVAGILLANQGVSFGTWFGRSVLVGCALLIWCVMFVLEQSIQLIGGGGV